MDKKYRWNNETFPSDGNPHYYDVKDQIHLRPLEIRTFGLKNKEM